MAMTEKFTADDRFLCFNAPSLFEAIERREKKPHQQQWNKYYFPAGRLYLSLRRHSQMLQMPAYDLCRNNHQLAEKGEKQNWSNLFWMNFSYGIFSVAAPQKQHRTKKQLSMKRI